MALYRGYAEAFPGVPDISVADARRLFNEGRVLFIDTRTREERAVSMLPGAVTPEAFAGNTALAEGKVAVAYCTVGYRSGVFAEKAAGGNNAVKNLAGGILAWILTGGKVYAAGAETRRVHVYGKKWNHAPEGYEVVMFGLFRRLMK